MPEDTNTLEGAIAFLNRIKRDAETCGLILLTPFEFVRAVELGAIEYVTRGVSIGGTHVGECSAEISGTAVRVAA